MSISDRLGEIQERADRATDAVADIEQAIEQVAKRLHSSYCECEGWHTECQGPQVGDRRVARRLAAEGLIAPAPLGREWAIEITDPWGELRYDRHPTREAAEDARWSDGNDRLVHRWVTAWGPADGIDRSEGGTAATSD